jgi:hypothetical protein
MNYRSGFKARTDLERSYFMKMEIYKGDDGRLVSCYISHQPNGKASNAMILGLIGEMVKATARDDERLARLEPRVEGLEHRCDLDTLVSTTPYVAPCPPDGGGRQSAATSFSAAPIRSAPRGLRHPDRLPRT